MTEPVNQFHRTLRQLSDEDPTLQQAIAFVHGAIRLQTHGKVKADPGVQAWFKENWGVLSEISRKRREAYGDQI